jgi:FkbM family methyltransferase
MSVKKVFRVIVVGCLSLIYGRSAATSTFEFLGWNARRFGALKALGIWARARRLNGIEGRVAEVPLPDGTGSVLLRIGTTDNAVYDQVFCEQEYKFNVDSEPRFILDAGAHIGLAALFFARRFPNARIVSIEPDRSNWQLARKNTAKFPNVTILRGALWNREAHLAIANPDDSPWGFRVMEDLAAEHASEADCGLSLPGFTIEGLREHFGAQRIDVFKMDIEGSEIEVLPTVDMTKVGLLACETHDNVRPGCSDALRAVTPGWRKETAGEWSSGITHILRPQPS